MRLTWRTVKVRCGETSVIENTVGRALALHENDPGLILHNSYNPTSPIGVIPECRARTKS